MSYRYKAVIYDCDGVMFDSFEANLAFYQRIMDMMGRAPLDRGNGDHMRILHTYSHREVLAHFFPLPEDWDEALGHAANLDYRDLVPLMRMEDGLSEILQRLHHRIGLAICTNRSTSMDMVLESFRLTPYFDCVMTAAKVANPKPHPEPLHKVLAHYGISPAEALFVGDSDVDRQAAQAAGVPFVAYKADMPALACIGHHREVLPLL